MFLCSGSVIGAFLTRYGPPPAASETLWPSRGQGFPEPEALDSQKMMSHLVWGPLPLQVSSMHCGGLGAARQDNIFDLQPNIF